MLGLDRITQDPVVKGGRPCIRGMRVTVGMVVGQIAVGVSIEALLKDYPYLERKDVAQALRAESHPPQPPLRERGSRFGPSST
jgi:uncharacterized protein (DUF433 family)